VQGAVEGVVSKKLIELLMLYVTQEGVEAVWADCKA
jgi:hypothetical protein